VGETSETRVRPEESGPLVSLFDTEKYYFFLFLLFFILKKVNKKRRDLTIGLVRPVRPEDCKHFDILRMKL
jgi:hypothetical protein